MTNLPDKYISVPASSLNGSVSISHPISVDEAKNIIQIWVDRQGKYWPPELTAEVLFKNMLCVYAPNWILYASASGSWSASIGIDKERYEICSSCKGTRGSYQKDIYGDSYFRDCPSCEGKGQVKKRYTEWSGQSGVASGQLNGTVVENTANDVQFRCGKRDFKAPQSMLSEPFSSDIMVLQPKSTSEASGKQLAEDLVRYEVKSDAHDAASHFGRVKDLQLAYVHIDEAGGETWLYPFFLGTYVFDDTTHSIEIDGITGKLHVDIPKSVRYKQIARLATAVAILVAAVVVITLAVYLGVIIVTTIGEYVPQLW